MTTQTLLARSWRSWWSREPDCVGPGWLQWVWTGLFCAAVALGITLLGMAGNASRGGSGWMQPSAWLRYFSGNLGVALTIGVLIHLMFDLAVHWLGQARVRRFSHGQRAAFFTAVPLLGVLLGWPLGVYLFGSRVGWGWPDNLGALLGSVAVALLISCVILLVFDAKARQIEAEKRAVEAQLRLLQGQMEPHFLFNTLANVLTLIDTDAARARSMLEAFTDYLRSSLGSLRGGQSSLGDEIGLVESYLQLQHLRMDDRLRYAIEVDAGLRDLPMPPLLLQPLVENAVLHGLEPKVEGGRLRIEARAEHDQLVLTVTDDGLGPDATGGPAGNGLALANLRERLRATFGEAASLALQAADSGTRATVRLPLQRSGA